jgi:hypothetical protein
MIRIKSKTAGFRRCGIAHPAQWVEYPDGKFSDEELKRLEAEPMLAVEKAAGGEKTEGGPKKKGGK